MVMLYMDDGIPVNSATFADEETWVELIGTAGRTFSYMHTAGGFAESAGTALCKENVRYKGKMSLVYCHYSCVSLNKMKIFYGGDTSELCSGISVGSGGCLPPFANSKR